MHFVRVGTLDDPAQLPPHIFIFTSSKQPRVVLPGDTPAGPECYSTKDYGPASSLARRSSPCG